MQGVLEVVLKLLEKLEIRNVLISITCGFILCLIIPENFIINKLITKTFHGLNIPIITIIFYSLLSYIMIDFISRFKDNSANDIYKEQQNETTRQKNVLLLNSLVYEQKLLLLRFLKSNNQKITIKLSNPFIDQMVYSDWVQEVPNSYVERINSNVWYGNPLENQSKDFILSYEFYQYLKYYYDKGDIFKDL